MPLELLHKYRVAGAPIFCAISAPSSLAVELADHFGVTLAGFLRDDRFNIYTHPARIGQPQEGVSINQFISAAVSEKISAIMPEDYLRQRANRADREAFRSILDSVPNRPPLPGDEL